MRSLDLSGPLALILSIVAPAISLGAVIVALGNDSDHMTTGGGASSGMMSSRGSAAGMMNGAGRDGTFTSAMTAAARGRSGSSLATPDGSRTS